MKKGGEEGSPDQAATSLANAFDFELRRWSRRFGLYWVASLVLVLGLISGN